MIEMRLTCQNNEHALAVAEPLCNRIDTYHSLGDLRRLADVWVAGSDVRVLVAPAVDEPPEYAAFSAFDLTGFVEAS